MSLRLTGKNGLVALAAALVLFGAGSGLADDEQDHDRARQALKAGEALPLRTILERVEHAYPGQIMEVDLERQGGLWLYEIKLLRPGGALVKLKIDARDGKVLGVHGRRDKSGRQGGKH